MLHVWEDIASSDEEAQNGEGETDDSESSCSSDGEEAACLSALALVCTWANRTLGSLLLSTLAGVLGLASAGPVCSILIALKSPLLLLLGGYQLLHRYCRCLCKKLRHLRAESSSQPAYRFKFWLLVVLGPLATLPLLLAPLLMLCGLLASVILASALWPASIPFRWAWLILPTTAGMCNSSLICDCFRASCHVIWAVDILTNLVICMRAQQVPTLLRDLADIAKGKRSVARSYSTRLSLVPFLLMSETSQPETLQRKCTDISIPLHDHFTLASGQVPGAIRKNVRRQCKILATSAVRQGLVDPRSCANCEPYVLVGLMAVVVLQICERSPPGANIEVVPCSLMNTQSFTRGLGGLEVVWRLLLEAKSALENASLSSWESSCFEVLLLLGQAPDEELSSEARRALRACRSLSDEQSSELTDLASHFNRAAMEVTRQRSLGKCMQKVLAEVASKRLPSQLYSRWCRLCQGHRLDESGTMSALRYRLVR